MKTIIFITFILFNIFSEGMSQSCCSASTPVTGNLQISNVGKKSMLFSLNFLYENFSTVYEGDKKVNEKLRERAIFLSQFDIHYGISDKVTLALTVPLLYQQRKNRVFDGSQKFLTVRGLGDISVLFKYAWKTRNILSSSEIVSGSGIKLPTGKNDLQVDNILISPELQPGTGSVDLLFWFLYSHGYTPSSRFSYQIVMSYTFTGRNALNYEFGDEWLMLYAQRIFQRKSVTFHLQLFSRFLQKEKRDDVAVENTGGWRIFFSPLVTVKIFRGFNVSGEYQQPVYHHVNGIQLTSTRRIIINLSFYR